MKVAVSTIGKFHTFELARELRRQDAVAAIFSGYPRFKLKHEQLPGRLIKTYPWIHTPYMIPRLRNALGTRAIRAWEPARSGLTRFHPAGAPDPDRFDVLFVGGMSLRKGVQYLVQAYQRIQHPRLSITFAGIPDPHLIAMLRGRGLWPEQARVIGHVPQPQLKELMSRSHVLVLPSVEEGLALVLAQAMACGCPVVATENTGAGDLLEDGVGGFILPIRDVDQLAERLQRLADQPTLRDALSEAATARVRALGGWSDYGNRAMKIYSDLTGHGTRTP